MTQIPQESAPDGLRRHGDIASATSPGIPEYVNSMQRDMPIAKISARWTDLTCQNRRFTQTRSADSRHDLRHLSGLTGTDRRDA